MDPKQLFQDGKIEEAIQALSDSIRANPTDAGLRTFLFDLLCFQGNLERAVKQLDLIADASPDSQTAAMTFRGVIFAEESRRKVLAGREAPKFFMEPPAYVEQHLEALRQIAAGNLSGANDVLAAAEAEREAIPGKSGDTDFDDIRDCDDVIGPILEFVFQSDYYWIPLAQVNFVTIEAPKQPRDLIWTQARITMTDNMPRGGYVPVLYNGTHTSSDGSLRIGRGTDWIADEEAPVRGIGQRTLLIGEDAVGFLELRKLMIKPPPKAAVEQATDA